MIAITSRQAYLEIQPKLPGTKKKICNYVLGHPGASNRQIAEATGLELGNVSGRVNELVNKDSILKTKERSLCPISGRNVYKWEIR